jgi:MFS transporter, Spinster family, sphingosine-1-phosphate transporter
VLTAALTLSYVDRYLIAVCIQPIKAELHLSDTALGVLTGFAFSAFYATLGLPIARISDRGWRREVIAVSIFAWSAMTAVSGLVQNLAQMVIARFAVGAGEAGVFPTSQALISDCFNERRRTTALAIFATGGSIGLLIAFAAGSWLENRLGWRLTFVVMAIPGLPLAFVAARCLPKGREKAVAAHRPLGTAVRELWRVPEFRVLPFAQSALVVLLFGQAQWLPAYIERSFGVSRVVLGRVLGVSQAVAIISGMVIGGVLVDRLRQRDPRWPIRIALGSVLAALIPMLLLYTTHVAQLAFVLAALTSFCLAIPAGPIAAHLQWVFGPELRASASAGALVIASLLGLGAGPVVIGGLSDYFSVEYGAEGLRFGLLTTAVLAVAWCAAHLLYLLKIVSAKSRG